MESKEKRHFAKRKTGRGDSHGLFAFQGNGGEKDGCPAVEGVLPRPESDVAGPPKSELIKRRR